MKRVSFAVLALLLVQQLSFSAPSPVVISEFLAFNSTPTNSLSLLDDFRELSDWIEIRNTTNATVNLENWALTDDPAHQQVWRFPATNLSAGAYLIVFASGRNRAIPGAVLHTDFRLNGDGDYLALLDPDGNVATEFAPQFPPQVGNVSYGFGILSSNLSLVTTNSSVRVRVPTTGSDGTNWTYAGYDDATWASGLNGVGYSAANNAAVVPFVKNDVSSTMSNLNASAYLRYAFNVSDPTNIALLTLRLRYDDGVVVWVNGVELARANAPDPVAFNSAATAAHSPAAVEEFRFGVANDLLRPGANVLAIQGLNLSPADADFLVVAELTATMVVTESTEPSYLPVPTPGAPNSGGSTNIGPIIRDVVHTPNVPLDADDLVVTARVLPSFRAVTNVVLQYRVMFGPNVPLPMFDDGSHGDASANDGLFTAVIPASASTNGQMVRYFVQAWDSSGTVSRYPLFTSPAETAEYLGTVVNGEGITSKLPVVHLFVNPTQQSAVDSQAGGRASAYHDGEFYDNISMQVRGNTTAGYLKKSHRLEFNREHPFRHPGPGPRIRKTSFVADYPDPTYMRQRLAFWLCDALGSPAPFYYPMRLQLNGDFYQLANHNDVHGEELLSRLGYDPNGALYNAAGTVQPSQFSTGGFEKKTRKFEGNADYTALAIAISETNNVAARATNVFDLFDIPNALDYLVAARWSHENDDVWANMSLYHDNDGDGLWRIVAFDMNLSWGAIYYEGGVASVIEGVQATNDIHKAHPLYGSEVAPALNSANYNRVYDSFFKIPQLREMFLRRLRTMMDTYILPPDTHPLAFTMERKILEWRDLIAEEANRDRDKWGWPPKGGQCNFDPGIRLTNGVDAMNSEFVVKRRIHFYNKHSVTNASPSFPVGITKTNNAGIPLSQPDDARIDIAAVEYNPASGNQLQEFICVTNPNNYAVDISGWKLGGGVSFTFHPGTVLPSRSAAYVSPDVKAFRVRTTGPRGGQALLVLGPYQGQLSARGETLYIVDQKGRGVSTNSYAGAPSLAQQFLRITEIMYNPSPFGADDPQSFEYLELKNLSSDTTLDLTGVRLVNGVTFNFTGAAITNLAPGQRLLVVRNAALFTARYGSGLPVAGQYAGNLENNGERITLVDAMGEEILDFKYENDWYPITDGAGFSLAIVDENADPDLWDSKTNWRPSGTVNGAPGQPDPAPPVVPPVLISEVLSHTDPPAKDTVELFNPTASPVNINDWYLSDDFGTPRKFHIPDTTIPAGGYVTFDEDQFNTPTNAPTSFALSSKGDEIYLFSASGTNLTGYVQGYSFGAAENGVSFGRYITSQTNVHFVAQSALTLGSANAGPKVGPVVISEIMYHPPDLPGARDDALSEYVELQNISAEPVPLFDPAHPANPWRLRGGIDLVLPPGLTLAPGGFLVAVNFDPNHVDDAAKLAAFRAKYGISDSVILVGPYAGKLNNDSDNIRLERPEAPEAVEVPYILVDRVEYEDHGAWPEAADGTGAALHRIAGNQYGNDPINWRVGSPDPGSASAAVAAPTITVQPVSTAGLASLSASFSVVAAGTGPFRYQWRFNGVNIDQATGSTLVLNNLQVEQAGLYSVVVYNSGGAVLSSAASLQVLLPAFFLTQPLSVNLRGSTNNADYGFTTNNATFSAFAKGVGTLHYQWRFNGRDIPGATGTSYTITGVQLTNDGIYDVLVTDQVGSIPSSAARLKVLVPPTVVIAPLNQAVPSNSTFTASVVARGNPPPFRYEWREISTIRSSVTTDQSTNFFTSLPITNVASRQWRLVIFNEANPSPGLLAAFNVITVPDTDGDGIPDSVDPNPGSAVDRTLDSDGDGVSNYGEFISGTDPNDNSSYLKVTRLSVGTGAEVVWQAVSNKTYSVQYTDDLGGGTWTKLGDVVATATTREVSVPDPNFTTNRFYRLVTPQR